MKVTISNKLDINIEGIEPDNTLALIRMIEGAGLEERRIFYPIKRALTKTPLDKLEWSKAVKLAHEVKEMRRLQAAYFKTRGHEVLKASIVQERKVDDMVNEILNKL